MKFYAFLTKTILFIVLFGSAALKSSQNFKVTTVHIFSQEIIQTCSCDTGRNLRHFCDIIIIITLTSIYPVKSKDPTTSKTVPTENRKIANNMALHGTFGGGLIN